MLSPVQRYFYGLCDSGLLRIINHLVSAARDAEGREASLSAGVIESHSVKTTDSDSVLGYEEGKKIRDRQRQVLTDTLGILVGLVVHPADVQDQDGASRLLRSIQSAYLKLRPIFSLPIVVVPAPCSKARWIKTGRGVLEIAKRSDASSGLEVVPRC